MTRLLATLTDLLLAKRGLAVSLLGVGLAGLIVWQAPQGISNSWFDMMNRIHPRSNDEERVIVVTIDEASVEAVGAWPWPRAVNAELMERIASANPQVVGIDIIYAEEDSLGAKHLAEHAEAPASARDWLRALESGDHDIRRALAKAPFVLAVGDVGHDPTNETDMESYLVVRDKGVRAKIREWKQPFQPLRTHGLIRETAAGEGIVAQHNDFDGVARRTGQVFDVGGDFLMQGFVAEVVRVASGANNLFVMADADGVRRIQYQNNGEPVVQLTTEPDGAIRPWFSQRNKAQEIPALSLLQSDDDLALLTGKIVLVGYSVAGGLDELITPLGELVPGVEAHRQTIESIALGPWLMRPAWAEQAEFAIVVFLALVTAFAAPRLRMAWGAIVAAGVILLPLGGAMAAYVAFKFVFDGAVPAIAVAVAGGLAYLASMALSERDRRIAAAARQRLDGEMAAAKRIQMGILPKAAEVFPDEQRFSIAAMSEPARTVGGDLYDFFLLDDKRLFFLVGDVSGKGPEASLFMAISKALCKSSALRGMQSIGDVLEQANSEIARDNPGTMFVTAFAGILDVETGELEFCSAGHEQPWLIHSDGEQVRLEGEGGPPLCLLDEFPFPTDKTQLQPGDVLVVVTDGVTEAQNIDGDLFGIERTDAALADVAGMADAAAVLDTLVAPVNAFAGEAEPADDLTAIIICWPGPANSSVEAA